MKPFKINHVSEISLSYHSKVAAKDRPKIGTAEDAYNLLYALWDKDKIEFQEQFCMLLLTNANRVLGRVHLSSGGTTGTLVDLKYIVVSIAKANASAIILAHNHPSGTLKPSKADIELTLKIRDICKILGTPVLDHIIVTPHDGYFSFADHGIL